MQRTVSAITLSALVFLAPQLANAEGEATSRMAAMEQRLLALEDQLTASNAVIEAQNDMLKASHGAHGGGGLDGFLNDLEIGGHVTSSYVYNYNNPALNNAGGSGIGTVTAVGPPVTVGSLASPQALCQFNCNHNEFSLDAVKLEIGKAADSPGEAGFQIDLLWGQNANILGGRGATAASDFSNTYVQEAYVSYNWEGTELRLGKWETLLGWELIDSNLNYNVTHGILFTWAIPLVHTGVLASGSLGEGLGWALGVTNGFNNSIDTDDNKGVVGQLSFEQGPLFASISTYHGNLGETRQSPFANGTTTVGNQIIGDNQPFTEIYDLVVSFSPNEQMTTWLNVDVGQTDFKRGRVGFTDNQAEWRGAAAGFNFMLSEKLSLAMRGEWFEDDNNSRFGFTGAEDTHAASATATVGYKLTDNLQTRVEVRHDRVDSESLDVDPFPRHSQLATIEDNATYGIVEVSYSFD